MNLVLKYLIFVKNIVKIIKQKKESCFHAYDQVSRKIHIVFSYNKEKFKKYFSMHFSFNNQFIKVIRPKFQKKIFCFLLISGITNLFVKHIPDIKFFC